MRQLQMPRIACLFVTMLGIAATACGGAGDPEGGAEGRVRVSPEAARSNEKPASPCEAIQVDTWFGPAKTAISAELSCQSILEQECAALGCSADSRSISVRGYGSGGADMNYYCQGVVEDFSADVPAYLASCR